MAIARLSVRKKIENPFFLGSLPALANAKAGNTKSEGVIQQRRIWKQNPQRKALQQQPK